MSGKSIIAGLLTVLLVLAGVYYFTNKGKNFSLFSQKPKITTTNKTTNAPGTTSQTSPANLKGSRQIAIEMSANAFRPAMVTIDAGSVVTWKNSDTVSHFVSTDSTPALEAQNSGEIKLGEMYSIKFDGAGQYSYQCTVHAAQGMRGQITVE